MIFFKRNVHILVLSWVPKTLFPDALVRQSKRTLIRVAFLLKIVCEFRGNNVFGTQDSTSMLPVDAKKKIKKIKFG